VQHTINKLDFRLLVNLNIISKKHAKEGKRLPKTGRGKFEQFQMRVQAAGAHKTTPPTFTYLAMNVVLLQRQLDVERSNPINFQQLICLTLVFDHNNLVKQILGNAISRYVHLPLFKKAYISKQSPYKLREMKAI
jgi:hypothetical protein